MALRCDPQTPESRARLLARMDEIEDEARRMGQPIKRLPIEVAHENR